MKRKIAVILAADVAGYSRLIAEDEEETVRRFEGYSAVFHDFVERSGGRVFNTAGDAILAEFESAVEAVRCGLDVQESLKARNLAYPPSRHMNFRMGITIGDVVEREDGDLLGDGVNIAARLESVAPPGGICVSRSVHEAVASKMSVRFADAGPQALKNIPERVHAYTISLDDGENDSVVVSSSDVAPAAAARTRAITQVPWSSVVLGVLALVVAGIYAYKYLPTEVLEKVGFGETVKPAEDELPSKTVTKTPEKTETPTAEKKSPAEEPDKRTTSTEPAGTTPSKEPGTNTSTETTDNDKSRTNPLATQVVLTRQWTECHDGTDPYDAAVACKALIDMGGLSKSDLATIHYKYGRALRDAGDPDEAIKSYDQSIELDPSADAYNHRGVAYFDKGDFGRAINDYTEALRLAPDSAEAINNRAWTYYKSGDLSAALSDANRAVTLDTTKAYIYDTRGHINEAKGNRTAAIADYRKALDLDSTTDTSEEGLRRLGASTN